MANAPSLIISELLARYRTGAATPRGVLEALLETAGEADGRPVWITRLARERVMAYVDALDPGAMDRLPLYGIPFAIKDNIDLADCPTTAGCPAFSYIPAQSATVVQKLIEAGAIPLGKTNLDQFATGLVGTRSPYGACRNSFDARYISGGSSSGSAVAVATGLASFSLGTDTAGSGRVPAAFNNLIGLKPSNGRLSTRGVVPACRSVDCVSIFALTAADAARVLDAAQGFDAADPYSLGFDGADPHLLKVDNRGLAGLRFGVPRADQLQFFGDVEYQRLYGVAIGTLAAAGGSVVEIDFEPFLEAARLLYDGPWVAERYAAVGAFIEAHPEAVHPVTRRIIEAGKHPSAAAAFQGAYRLKELERRSEAAWLNADLILTPTAGTVYLIDDVLAEPLKLNANLGYYTNFMNLFDLCGVAVPAGFRSDGMPFGVTLVGPRASDHALLDIAGRLQSTWVSTVGALGVTLPPRDAASPAALPPRDAASPTVRPPPDAAPPATVPRDGEVLMAVCGAHMQGLPLNHQLRDRGGYLVQATHTSARYRLFALPGGPPHRPGMIRVNDGGAAIELEVWALPADQAGSFVAGIPAPLGVGKVELASGALVTGFLCEGYAADGAADITGFGGWRAYVKSLSG